MGRDEPVWVGREPAPCPLGPPGQAGASWVGTRRTPPPSMLCSRLSKRYNAHPAVLAEVPGHVPCPLPWEQGSQGEAVEQWAGQSRGSSQKLLDMPRARRAARVGGIWGGEGREDTATPTVCLSDVPVRFPQDANRWRRPPPAGRSS